MSKADINVSVGGFLLRVGFDPERKRPFFVSVPTGGDRWQTVAETSEAKELKELAKEILKVVEFASVP